MKPRRKSRNPPQVRLFQCPNCGRAFDDSEITTENDGTVWIRVKEEGDHES